MLATYFSQYCYSFLSCSLKDWIWEAFKSLQSSGVMVSLPFRAADCPRGKLHAEPGSGQPWHRLVPGAVPSTTVPPGAEMDCAPRLLCPDGCPRCK